MLILVAGIHPELVDPGVSVVQPNATDRVFKHYPTIIRWQFFDGGGVFPGSDASIRLTGPLPGSPTSVVVVAEEVDGSQGEVQCTWSPWIVDCEL